MFGFLKTFVRKLVAEPPAENPQFATQETEPGETPEALPPAPAFAPAAPRAVTPKNGYNGPQNGKGLQLPLFAILGTLPLELQPRVRNSNVGDRTIPVPLEKVLAQLSRGTITITFGELRHAAPDVFSPENDRDKVMVPLPLAEVLARLNPALITRRRVQRTVEIPDEISSPFDTQGNGLAFSMAPSKLDAAPAPAAPPRHTQPAQPTPTPAPAAARGSLSSAPTPAPASLPQGAQMISPIRAFREQPAPRPTAAPVAPAQPTKISGDTERLAMAAAAAAVPEPAKPAVETPSLLVALTALADGWPEGVRKEIVEANLVDAKVALPCDSIKQALKQGRIAFSWKTIRSWLKSGSVAPVSPHDSMILELPLKVVAPLFLARQQEAQKSQQKVAIDVEIPNLFFGFPQPEGGGSAEVGGVATSAPARPSDTNYYVWSDTSDTARVDITEVKRGPTPGTRFVAKYATPNEVVSRAAALEGVAGALIALPDGLMVANQIPADLNADTIAAFLPQIFSKVSSCTKELRMGDLNNLNFTIGNIPWKIFRVNAIFFAAFGRAGQPLPTAQLAALAGELDHKPK